MAELKIKEWIISTPLHCPATINTAKALVNESARLHSISATICYTCYRKGQLHNTVLEALERVQPELCLKLPSEIPSKWKQNVGYSN